MAGREESLGKKNFLILYFSSGVVGGLLQILGALWLPNHFGGAVVGASAGVFGLVAAFAVLYPERPLTLLLFFFIPVNMRAKYLLLFSALLALFGIRFPVDNVAHAAHLGGMLTGLAYVRWILHAAHPIVGWPPFRPRIRPRELVNAHSQKTSLWRRPKSSVAGGFAAGGIHQPRGGSHPGQDSEHGIQSLTARERQILEAARAKMARR